jgi:hypothetical protein
MCTNLVLTLPYFTKAFVLECDTSIKGIIVTLMKEGCLLSFMRKQYYERYLQKSTYENEMMAMLQVVDI